MIRSKSKLSPSSAWLLLLALAASEPALALQVVDELTRSDDSLWHSTTVFGGQAEPALKVMMTSDDYKAMMSGELNSQMAFLTGKLKFEGSLPMLMQLGALAS